MKKKIKVVTKDARISARILGKLGGMASAAARKKKKTGKTKK